MRRELRALFVGVVFLTAALGAAPTAAESSPCDRPALEEVSTASSEALRAEIGRLTACAAQMEEFIEVQHQMLADLRSVDEETRLEATALQREYDRFALDHQKRTFWWQLIVSYAFSLLILALVGFGMALSWLQFRSAAALKPEETKLDSELEVSAQKLKVRTSLVGVLLLALAFAFTVVFMAVVYDIEVLGPSLTPPR